MNLPPLLGGDVPIRTLFAEERSQLLKRRERDSRLTDGNVRRGYFEHPRWDHRVAFAVGGLANEDGLATPRLSIVDLDL